MKFKNPLFLYLATPLVALFPCLILGYVYFDGDILIYNGIVRQFFKNSLLSGQIPLWNPYLFAGQPFWADPSSMVCYPLLYPTLLFPTAYGLGVFNFLHLFLAAWGTRFWLKKLNLSEESCWVGAVSFAFSGFFWNEISHPMCVAAFAWIPWCLGSLEEWTAGFTRRSAFRSGLAFALLFLTGCFQIILGALYFGLFYFLFRSGTGFLKANRKERTRVFISIGFFTWGFLPFLFLWIPCSEFMSFSDRLHTDLSYENFNAGISINPSILYQFLFPVHPIDRLRGLILPFEEFAANAGFLGIWAPFLILLAFRKTGAKILYFLLGTAVLALLVCLGKYFFLHKWFTLWVPGFHLLRGPFRFLYLYIACFSVLTAYGYEEISKNARVNFKTIFLFVCFVGGALILRGTALPLDQIFFLFLGGLGLCGWPRFEFFPKAGKWIFLTSIFLSLLTGGWSICPSRMGPPSNLGFEKETPLMAALSEKMGHSRIFLGDNIPHEIKTGSIIQNEEFPANAACLFKIRNIGGYNTLSLGRRGELHTLPFKTFVRLMALGGFITGNEKGEVPGFTRNPWGPLRFYGAKEPNPFLYAPEQIEVVPDGQALLKNMGMDNFNPYQKSFLGENPPSNELFTSTPTKKNHLEYRFLRDDLNEQVFETKLDRAGWVVFSEVAFPGWKAWVDHKAQPLFTANYLFRGLFIPGGTHEIRFQFKPWWYPMVFAGLGFWLLLTFLLVKQNRKGSKTLY